MDKVQMGFLGVMFHWHLVSMKTTLDDRLIETVYGGNC